MPAFTPASDAAPMIRGENVTKVYVGGTVALEDVSVDVRGREFVALLGPSGCGKSTLLRMIAGLEQPTSGRMTIHGNAPDEARGDLSFVFQDAALLPWRTVRANVALPLELRKTSIDQDAIRAMLDLVGLSDFAEAYPAQLSGGMKMRVSLARALISKPRILLMDEPFAALDELTRQKLNGDLLAMTQALGTTVVFVTHNVFEAAFLASRVLVLSARPGRIARDVACESPFPRPATYRSSVEFSRTVREITDALEH